MAEVYDWYAFPHKVDIVCPSCSCMARFEFAEVVQIKLKKDVPYFQSSDVFEYQQFMDSCGHTWHAAIWFKGMGRHQIESVTDLPDGYSAKDWHHSHYFRTLEPRRWGTAMCTECQARVEHRLEWPMDAWWSVEVKGDVLWAFNRQSTADILGFIEAKHRRENDFEWGYMLRHLPTHFLQAKNRDTVCKRLRRILDSHPTR